MGHLIDDFGNVLPEPDLWDMVAESPYEAMAYAESFIGTDTEYSEIERASISIITASDLMQLELPEPRWAVEPILPEGLTVLAGAPKVGKSWMALSMAYAIASGGKILDAFQANKGKVLYFSLEDNKKRLQDRLEKLDIKLDSNAHDLMLSCSIPPYNEDGLQALEELLDTYPDCRMVIIDTLSRFRPSPKANMNAYDNDYHILAPMQQLAMSKHIALVVITHLRKSKSLDPLEEVTGSTGITGAADAVWILKRARGDDNGTLSITGRDVEDCTLAVKFNKSTCMWVALGDAAKYLMGKERQQIFDFLQKLGRPVGPKEVAETLGQKEANVKNLMWKMNQSEQLSRSARGLYSIPDPGDDFDNFLL